MTKLCKAKEQVDESTDVFYKRGEQYEITVNPNKQYIGDLARMGKVTQDVSRVFDKWKEHCTFALYPEISELRFGNKDRGNTSRIHFHGTFTIMKDIDVGMLLLYLLPDLKAQTDFSINKLREDYWPIYLKKQEDIMTELCLKYRVPYGILSQAPLFKLSVTGINGFRG